MHSRLVNALTILLAIILLSCTSTAERQAEREREMAKYMEPAPESLDRMMTPGGFSAAETSSNETVKEAPIASDAPQVSMSNTSVSRTTQAAAPLQASASSQPNMYASRADTPQVYTPQPRDLEAAAPMVSAAPSDRFIADASSRNEKDVKKEKNEKKEKKDKSYFIDPDKYTTDGAKYQQKYKSSLQSIISALLRSNMVIKEESVGFYFDKQSDNKKLYVGLDLMVDSVSGKDYGARAGSVIKSNVKYVMDTIISQKAFFDEEQITGIVIGFLWKEKNVDEQVNIWIQSSDAMRCRNNELTLDELIHRSFLTNAQGRIIILK